MTDITGCCSNYITDTQKIETIRQELLLTRDIISPLYVYNLRRENNVTISEPRTLFDDDSLKLMTPRSWLDYTCLSCDKKYFIPMCSGFFSFHNDKEYFSFNRSPFFETDHWVDNILQFDHNDNLDESLTFFANRRNIVEVFNDKGLPLPKKYIILSMLGSYCSDWLWLGSKENFPIKFGSSERYNNVDSEHFNMSDYYDEEGELVSVNNDRKGICINCVTSWKEKGLVHILGSH